MSAAERRLPLTLAAWDLVEAALKPLTPRERLMLLQGMRERLEAKGELPEPIRFERAHHLKSLFPWTGEAMNCIHDIPLAEDCDECAELARLVLASRTEADIAAQQAAIKAEIARLDGIEAMMAEVGDLPSVLALPYWTKVEPQG